MPGRARRSDVRDEPLVYRAIVSFRGNRALAAGIVALAALAALPLLVGEGGLMSSLVITLIKQLRSQGLAILLSEQNARMSLAIADRAYVIEMGRAVMQGRGQDLLGKAEIAERYLGVGAAVDAVDRAHADARYTALVQGLERILRG
jgi:hypothetical protein